MLAPIAFAIIAALVPAAVQDQTQELPPVAEALKSASAGLTGLTVPRASDFVAGNLDIAARSTRPGPVAIMGTLRVSGTIDGDAFAYGGDIIVLDGGHITGSAVAIGGRVQLTGGAVDGEIRGIGGSLGTVALKSPAATTRDLVGLTFGWAGVALIIGLGILVFGGRTLDVVSATISEQFGRSFAVGLGATLGAAPLLALLVIALTLTILGVLLVPFAIVAYVLAGAGLLALGFLAAVRVTGHALGGARSHTERGAALRALVVGIVFFLGLWLIAAIATPWPMFATVMRVIAFALTWAATTLGLGATIVSRAGTRTTHKQSADAILAGAPPYAHAAVEAAPLPDWTTPTPVSGVVAARRRPSAQQKTIP